MSVLPCRRASGPPSSMPTLSSAPTARGLATRTPARYAAPGGCLYYGALRPEEAVALRQSNLDLPTRQRGELILTGACPRTASPWTSTDTPHKPRGLKYRPESGASRPCPSGLGRPAPRPPARVRDRAGRATVSRGPRRNAQRIGLRPGLARRPGDCAWLGTGRYAADPPTLRPAACRLVLVAERYRRARRGSRTRREQRPRLARDTADGFVTSRSARKSVTQDCVTGFDLGKLVAGVGFEPT